MARFLFVLPFTHPEPCFFPGIFSASSAQILVPTLELLAETVEDPELAAEMLPLPQMAILLLDWTDPAKIVEREGLSVDYQIQVDIACDIIKSAIHITDRETKKVFLSLLSKLHMPDEIETVKLYSLTLLVRAIIEKRPPADAASRNALTKFSASLTKKYPEQMEGFSEDALRGEVEYQEELDFIDDIDVAMDEKRTSRSTR